MPPARIPGRLTSSRSVGSARSVIFCQRDTHRAAVWLVCHIPLDKLPHCFDNLSMHSCEQVTVGAGLTASLLQGGCEGAAAGLLRVGGKRGLEPGARTGRPGRSPAPPERIGLLSNGLRPARTCPRFLLLGLFLRLSGDAALCDRGRRFGCGTYRRQCFRWGRRHPRRICIAHDGLRWRLVCGQPGIRRDGGLHQPIENDEKAQVRCNDESDGGG